MSAENVEFVRVGESPGRPVNIIAHAGGWSEHDRYVHSSRTSPDDLREWRNPLPKFGLRVASTPALDLWREFAAMGYIGVTNLSMDDRLPREQPAHYSFTSPAEPISEELLSWFKQTKPAPTAAVYPLTATA